MMQSLQLADRALNAGAVPTINARDIHALLEVGRDFNTWIKSRIDKFRFVEGHDYVTGRQNGGKPQGGRPLVEYYVSVDMGKQLAMVERNAKGKQARKYFIECERRAKAPAAQPTELTRMQLIQLAMQAEAKELALGAKERGKTLEAAALLNDPQDLRDMLLSFNDQVVKLKAENEAMPKRMAGPSL